MTKTTLGRLLAAASVFVAVFAATVLGDAFRLVSAGDLRGGALAAAVVAALGGAFGAAYARIREAAVGRSAAIGALTAAHAAFLLLRLSSPWIDLGAFGAGPVTAIALVLLPTAQLTAILTVTRWTAR
jgi:hypothetical protein